MPIYEYRCGECGFQKEYLQKLSDAPLKDCPECGKPALNKLVTAAGFQLKGSGWYVTDFRNGSKTKPADKPADTAAEDKPAAKADAKPEGKQEAKPAADTAKAETPAAKPAAAATPATTD